MNKKNDSAISNITDLLTKLGELDSFDGLYFRGYSDFKYELKPSIYRNPKWIENEDIMFKEMGLKCPNDFHQQESTFQMLVKMQHYSLPTRLLDLTENPLIALYFACSDNEDKNGEIVVLKFPIEDIRYHDSDTVSVISNISRRPKSFVLPKKCSLECFNKSREVRYLIHEIKREKPYFASKIERDHLNSVICVKPKLDNPRIIRQHGAFLLFGVNEEKIKPASVNKKFICPKKKIFVNASSKKLIMEQLRILGISKSTIFPEIDSVAKDLKDSYAK